MTTTTTIVPAVKVNTDSVMAGDVFYGSFDTRVKGKRMNVMVSNHLKDTDEKYNFRVVTKCKAGFPTISDCYGYTPYDVISGYKKNALLNVQVEVVYEDGHRNWMNVYTTKSGKWYSIDLGFLKVLTVGNMRTSFPDMCDMDLWELVGTKTWADKAFAK